MPHNFIFWLTWITSIYSQTTRSLHIRVRRQYGLDDAPAVFIGGPQNRPLGIQSYSPISRDSFALRPQPSPYLDRPAPSFQPYGGPSGRSDYPSPNFQSSFGYQPFQRSNGYYPNYPQPLQSFPYDPNGSWMPGQEPPTPSPRMNPPAENYGPPANSRLYEPNSVNSRNYGPPGIYHQPERRPIDLTIPSYAYVPNKFTGQGMQCKFTSTRADHKALGLIIIYIIVLYSNEV